jgi:two-component system, chemotaxis family, CheB/CheR fusion protein
MPARSASPSKRSKLARTKKIEPQVEGDFLIVAIGASAGGVEANTELVRNLPPDTGMAFVVIQHLDPNHPSIIAELLSKDTRMLVVEVENGMKVESNRIFVIPPNASMSISDHTPHLAARGDSRVGHTPIDRFMRSPAEAQGSRGIGVILSGSGTDGTMGMSEIHAHGGVTFAQRLAGAGEWYTTSKCSAVTHVNFEVNRVTRRLGPQIGKGILRPAYRPEPSAKSSRPVLSRIVRVDPFNCNSCFLLKLLKSLVTVSREAPIV